LNINSITITCIDSSIPSTIALKTGLNEFSLFKTKRVKGFTYASVISFNIVAVFGNNVEVTFDFVAKNGNNVERVLR